MVQYLVEPYGDEKKVVVTGAALDISQDVSDAVRGSLAARGFNDWSVEVNLKTRSEYLGRAA